MAGQQAVSNRPGSAASSISGPGQRGLAGPDIATLRLLAGRLRARCQSAPVTYRFMPDFRLAIAANRARAGTYAGSALVATCAPRAGLVIMTPQPRTRYGRRPSRLMTGSPAAADRKD